MRPLIFLVVFFMLSSPIPSSGSAFPIAKPGCDDQCGNVSIPFPFGTREGCYLDERFFINCSSSNYSSPSQPFLRHSNIDVKDISLEGQLRILNFIGHACYENNQQSKSDSPSIWLKQGSAMTFSSAANVFTTIGCDSYSFVRGQLSNGTTPSTAYTTGCMSVCANKADVQDGSCSGLGCCQTHIPRGAWEIDVTMDSFHNHRNVSSFNNCTYAFVVEAKAFQFFADNLTNLDTVTNLPVVVDWVIAYETCEVARQNSSSYVCGGNSTCYVENGTLGYRCKCMDGYEGNPYLPNGCQDIDECANGRYNCAINSVCGNTLGNYTCTCVQGYHGDGRGRDGCIADQKPNKKNYWPIFAGIGVSTGTAILLGCSMCLYFELMRRKENRRREDFFRKNGGEILQQKLSGQGRGTRSGARIFSIEELQKVTNNFDESQIIGKGGFGTVFKGELVENTTVAVKKSRGVDQHQVEQFINEVIVLSQINNRNVVKLLGCCLEAEVPLLVYEFIDNGTLFENLHNKIRASKLSWKIRLRIASEVAGVLTYLHSVASPPIIHRDIKSANILLDYNYTAKVADFGISRLVPKDENQVSTVVQGTQGYLDPEYMQTGLLTEKSDVYSFGIVLVELLTGKKVLAFNKPESERFLSNQFLLAIKGDRLIEVLDGNICYRENIEHLKKVAMLAKECLNVKGDDRPCMKDVARELEALEISAPEISMQVLEADSTKYEVLVEMQSKEIRCCDDTSSSDLYPVYHTTTQLPLLPTSGGR